MACFTVLDPKYFGYVDFDQLHAFMRKYDQDANTATVNAVLRRINTNEDFKISFREFSSNITPMMPGFKPQGCISRKTALGDINDPLNDDVLVQSKFKELLEHDGIAFNLD